MIRIKLISCHYDNLLTGHFGINKIQSWLLENITSQIFIETLKYM